MKIDRLIKDRSCAIFKELGLEKVFKIINISLHSGVIQFCLINNKTTDYFVFPLSVFMDWVNQLKSFNFNFNFIDLDKNLSHRPCVGDPKIPTTRDPHEGTLSEAKSIQKYLNTLNDIDIIRCDTKTARVFNLTITSDDNKTHTCVELPRNGETEITIEWDFPMSFIDDSVNMHSTRIIRTIIETHIARLGHDLILL